jgi:hypothetical protein
MRDETDAHPGAREGKDMLKRLPIGIQTFSKIIEEGYLYVDKTRDIHRLITEGEVYFLSRPRRFGKSLLLSTLEVIFQGRRDLFDGLWIAESDYGWEKHPVLHVDFSMLQVATAEELKQALRRHIAQIAHEHEVTLRRADGTYYEQFADLIRQIAERGRVAVLVDEYDKPIIDNIERVEEAQHIREVLKGFYTILKGMDRYLRFVLLTGVSKFSKVGVFSGLNNLKDITLDDRYATMLGITQAEMERDFQDYIHAFAESTDSSAPQLISEIRRWYDGFCFSKRCTPVYNPFSLLQLFDARDFRNHWFETGTPTFLVKLLRERGYDVQALENLRVDELTFSSYELEDLSPLPLLIQTGYLTIKGYDAESRLYQLSYPNYEVESAFVRYLLDAFSPVENGLIGGAVWQLKSALRVGDFEQFFQVLDSFFAGIPYDIQIRRERYYQTVFYLIFKLMSLEVQAEVRTRRGRVDVVVELDEGVYIFEFKLEGAGDAQSALAQIKERGYAEPYRTAGQSIYLIGAAFGLEEGSVVDWAVER